MFCDLSEKLFFKKLSFMRVAHYDRSALLLVDIKATDRSFVLDICLCISKDFTLHDSRVFVPRD